MFPSIRRPASSSIEVGAPQGLSFRWLALARNSRTIAEPFSATRSRRSRAKSARPKFAIEVCLNRRDGDPNGASDGAPSLRELDPVGAFVVSIVAAHEMAKQFGLPEQVVHGLPTHADLGGHLGGRRPSGPGYLSRTSK